jgi:hypothetical protein
MSIAHRHHYYGRDAQNHVKNKVRSEGGSEISRCPEASLNPQHMTPLALVVINLLEKEYSGDTDKDKVLQAFVSHIYSSKISHMLVQNFLNCKIHSAKHEQRNENKNCKDALLNP